jgi:hypothetical protein
MIFYAWVSWAPNRRIESPLFESPTGAGQWRSEHPQKHLTLVRLEEADLAECVEAVHEYGDTAMVGEAW